VDPASRARVEFSALARNLVTICWHNGPRGAVENIGQPRK
jgi:hypothetical protein